MSRLPPPSSPAVPDERDLTALADLASQIASTFVALASDIALVIDADGSVRHVAQGAAPLATQAEQWVGRPWAETVTRDTRRKIELLLQDVAASGVARRREVNVPSAEGADIPVSYAAIRLGASGPVLAVGRDLRAISAIQQRFTETQQEMERDYWKRRESESRYRLLFQVATDAVFVVDGLTLAIVEANRAGAQMFGLSQEQLVGRPITVGIGREAWPAVEELLSAARSTGRAAEIRVPLAAAHSSIDVSATPFRAERDLFLMVRARRLPERASALAHPPWAELMRRVPDAVVITDSSGRVLMANPAFVELCEADSEARLEGRALSQWLADAASVAQVLEQVKRHGIAGQALAPVRGVRGGETLVGVSAALLDEGDRECVGFSLRLAEERALHGLPTLPAARDLARSIDSLVALTGLKPLPQLLQAASDWAEQHFIRAALQQAGGERLVAATLLGIGEEALARRMHALGIDDEPAPHGPRVN